MSITDALCAWLYDAADPPAIADAARFAEAAALLDELAALGSTDPATHDALAGLLEQVLLALPPATRGAWAQSALPAGPRATALLTPFVLDAPVSLTDRLCAWLFDGAQPPSARAIAAAPDEALACLDELADLIAACVPEPSHALSAEARWIGPLEALLAEHLPGDSVATGPRGAALLLERLEFEATATAPITREQRLAPLPDLPEVRQPSPPPPDAPRRWPAVLTVVAAAAAILFFVLRAPAPTTDVPSPPSTAGNPTALVTAPPVTPASRKALFAKARPLAATEMRPKLMPIPGGTFMMGSPPNEVGHGEWEAQHQVTVSRPFYMARTEVTQRQWKAALSEVPSRMAERPRNPVESISWFDALRYVNALSTAEGLAPCYRIDGQQVQFAGLDCEGYRLPTEAEWEFAARAGTTTATYAGDLELLDVRNAPVLSDIAWYSGNAGLPDGPLACPEPDKMQFPAKACGTHPVATRRPNAYGLYDMIGNVWEWTHDNWGPPPEAPTVDPLGADDPKRRVTKGCGWFRDARFCRAANRYRPKPDYRSSVIGMRPVRTIR